MLLVIGDLKSLTTNGLSPERAKHIFSCLLTTSRELKNGFSFYASRRQDKIILYVKTDVLSFICTKDIHDVIMLHDVI